MVQIFSRALMACGFALSLGLTPFDAAAGSVIVETYADIDGLLPWSHSATDPSFATSESSFGGSFDGQAKARAEAETFGPGGSPVVRSQSTASDNVDNPIFASATAGVTTRWIANTDGSVVPLGGPVGVNTSLSFDGTLYANSGALPGAVGAAAHVSAVLVLHTQAGSSVVFNSNLTALDSMGTQFIVGGAGPFLQSYQRNGQLVTLDYDVDLLNLLSVTAGEPFDVQLGLYTNASVGNVEPPGDNLANADFFSTGLFGLFVSTPGVTLTRLDGITGVVPEPSAVGLLALGLLGLSLRARLRTGRVPKARANRLGPYPQPKIELS